MTILQSASSAADVPVEPPPTAAVEAAAGSSSRSSRSSNGTAAAAAAAAAEAAATQAGEAALAEVMLRRLQRLPWRRIDVSFGGAKWGLAHNNIQVGVRVLRGGMPSKVKCPCYRRRQGFRFPMCRSCLCIINT